VVAQALDGLLLDVPHASAPEVDEFAETRARRP